MDNDRSPELHIGQLSLRMPGTGAERGHRVADGIVRSLAREASFTGRQRRLGALSVRIQLPAGATESEMSDSAAAAIMRALQK